MNYKQENLSPPLCFEPTIQISIRFVSTTSIVLSSPLALTRLPSLLFGLAPHFILATALALTQLDQLQVHTFLLLRQDHTIFDLIPGTLRNELFLELNFKLDTSVVFQNVKTLLRHSLHSEESAPIERRFSTFQLFRKLPKPVLANGLKITVINVADVVFVPQIADYFSSVEGLIRSKFAGIETPHFDRAHWFGILRYIGTFSVLRFQVKLFSADNFKKSKGLGHIDGLELFIHFTLDRSKIEIVLPKTDFVLSRQ